MYLWLQRSKPECYSGRLGEQGTARQHLSGAGGREGVGQMAHGQKKNRENVGHPLGLGKAKCERAREECKLSSMCLLFST